MGLASEGQGPLCTALFSLLLVVSETRDTNRDHGCVKPGTQTWFLTAAQAQTTSWPWMAIKLLTSTRFLFSCLFSHGSVHRTETTPSLFLPEPNQ